MPRPLPALLALCAFALPAAAQQVIYDVEPNHSKELATPAFDLVAGDMLAAFGFGGCGAGPPDVEYFRVRTAALPPGIYRHDLVDMGSSAQGQLRLVGLDAIQETVIPGSYDYLQEAPLGGAQPAFVSWYGFGKSEELYVDLYASYSCRSFISTVLQTTPVTPTDIGDLSTPGEPEPRIGFTTSGANGPVDTEVQLFDAELCDPASQLGRRRPGPGELRSRPRRGRLLRGDLRPQPRRAPPPLHRPWGDAYARRGARLRGRRGLR